MSTYAYVCIYICYMFCTTTVYRLEFTLWYIIASAIFFVWCSLAWLKKIQKAKPRQAEPSQAAPNPSHAEEDEKPFRLVRHFFSSSVRLGGRTKPSQNQAEPHRRKNSCPSALAQQFFFFFLCGLARQARRNRPKKKKTFRPGSACFFSSVRLGSPNQAEPSQAKPNQSRAAPKKKTKTSARALGVQGFRAEGV